MSSIGVFFDEQCKRHVTGPSHPERPARLDAVRAALEWNGLLAGAKRIEAAPAERSVLEWIHAPAYIDRLAAACRDGRPFIDEPDSAICPESYEIGLLAAGGVIAAARGLGAGEIRRAFCAGRPPGHHAEHDRSMGFCLFNNVALAAEVLRREFGLQRVLILDWDVHHGNGTQHIFERDAGVLFVSLHGHPDHLYPGTGYARERGIGPGEGATLNVPMLPGAGDDAYRAAFEGPIAAAVEAFEPQAVLISAGFDAHGDDPLGTTSLTDDAYVWMLRRLLDWADRYADGRVLSVLEGGYDLGVLRRCVGEHAETLAHG